MKKGFIVLIVIGGVLTTAGAVMLGIGLSKEFKTIENVTHEYVLEESFENFNIDIDTADVKFYVATDGKNKVVCNEREKQYHIVSVSDNALTISSKDDMNWYERMFTFTPQKMHVDIYLAANSYNNLTYKASTGDITVPEGLTFKEANINVSTGDVYYSSQVTDALNIKTSTGDIKVEKLNNENAVIALDSSTGRKDIENVKAKKLTSTSSTGKNKITNSTFSGDLYIKASTGDVELVDSDAAVVNIETSTGDVNCVFLSGKSVTTETSTGDINVTPNVGGECHIKTSTGDITVSYKG